jgi:ABC-2 type transport system permease protein
MRLLWLSARKDLLRLRREPVTLLIWLGIPFLIALIMVAFFGRGGDPKISATLLIADQDNTLASNFLAGAYSQGQLGGMIAVEKVEEAAGRARIFDGKASALLVIPKGFSGALLAGKPIELTLLENPSQAIAPRLIREVTTVLLDGGSTLPRLLPPNMVDQIRSGAQPTDGQVVASAVAINQSIRKAQGLLFPPAIDVKEVAAAPAKPRPNMAALFMPSSLFTALLFLAFGQSADLWRERRYGTLRRLAAGGLPLFPFLAGKALAILAVSFVASTVGLFAGAGLLGVNVGQPVLAVVWAAAAFVGLYSFALFLQASARTARTAGILSNLVMMPAMMLGGCMFPFEILPASFARIGQWLPNGRALVEYKATIAGEMAAGRFAAALAAAAAWSALFFFLVVRQLRRQEGL